MAWMICGRLATSAGIALISPLPSVMISWTPAISSFGALSLMMPAMSDTMPGMYSIIVGSPSIRPCAMFKINWMPLSTSCPAFSRSPLARSATIGSAVLSRLGMPVTRPWPSWSIISMPLCKKLRPPTLVAKVHKDTAQPLGQARQPPLWKLSVSVCR